MSRRNGAAHAVVDTRLFDDPKVRKLARLQKDPHRTAESMTLYLATVLGSWADDEPLALDDATPAWFVADPSPLTADLITVGLLDADGKVPAATLESWMRPFRAAVEGGRARWNGRTATGVQQGSSRGAGGNERTNERTKVAAPRASAAPPRPFGEIMGEMGIKETIVKGKSS